MNFHAAIKNIYWSGLLFGNLALTSLCAQEPSTPKLKALYNSLDPLSIAQHLAFYELYPESQEGRQALQDAYRLLTGGNDIETNGVYLPPSLTSTINALVGLINKHPDAPNIELNEKELSTIDKLASRLPNRQLKGFRANSEEEILMLDPHHIDLARGVLLTQLGNSQEALRKIESYEAAIDLMALQILTRISLKDPPKAKIRAMNRFIFEEMGFRFPPHSVYAKDIDLYTFLPSVLDSRRGVCLGVSILYISLAQRLALQLEMVTPPGHIFVRWHQGKDVINIETTARGIHLPSEEYLGIDTRSLQQRNVKEVIGLAHYNQASVYWERKQHEKAQTSYVKAQRYLPSDKQLVELMGYNALMQGEKERGRELLKQVVDNLPEYAVSKQTIAEDFLNNNVDADGIEAIFIHVDETRDSLLEKRRALEEVIKKYPKFREGLFSLAGTWLQLHRINEALQALSLYHELDSSNATVEYYLAAIYIERLDYNNAWKHLQLAEKLVQQRQHKPKALLELRQELIERCPECLDPKLG